MLEKAVIKKLRDYLRKEYHATCHKYHGGALGETGHADLYGTAPNGQAFYIEVKAPGSSHNKERLNYQRIFLEAEQENGALVGFATCIEDVDKIMNGEAILWPRT